MNKKIVRCMNPNCNKDITNEIQVYYKGRVLCEDCNLKEDD